MKKLLARLRRLWEFLGCEHDKVHCFHFVVPKPAGSHEDIHVHLCLDCGLVTRFEVSAVQPSLYGGRPAALPLGAVLPGPGDPTWN